MNRFKSITYALVLATTLGGSALSIDQVLAAPANTSSTAAVRDFTKLSKDGGTAFRDIALARLAIYNAEPKLARELVEKAQASLVRAKADDTAFMKAEGDLMAAPAKPGEDAKVAPAAAAKPADSKPVAWLPVDGKMVLSEDFVASPQKTAAIKAANEHLAKGDQKAALEKLKLEGIGVSVTTAVLPLESTTAGVQKAASLIGEGKYYEANATLKGVEDGLRFDVMDVVEVPAPAKAAAAKPAAAATPAATPAPAKP